MQDVNPTDADSANVREWRFLAQRRGSLFRLFKMMFTKGDASIYLVSCAIRHGGRPSPWRTWGKAPSLGRHSGAFRQQINDRSGSIGPLQKQAAHALLLRLEGD